MIVWRLARYDESARRRVTEIGRSGLEECFRTLERIRPERDPGVIWRIDVPEIERQLCARSEDE